MARIALKNVLIEYQINVINKNAEITDCDHLTVFIGKNRFCRITDPVHSKLITSLYDCVKYCIATGYNDIEILVTAIAKDGEVLRENALIGDERVTFYNGDYIKIDKKVQNDWQKYFQQYFSNEPVCPDVINTSIGQPFYGTNTNFS